jgi:hypothetical protein
MTNRGLLNNPKNTLNSVRNERYQQQHHHRNQEYEKENFDLRFEHIDQSKLKKRECLKSRPVAENMPTPANRIA